MSFDLAVIESDGNGGDIQLIGNDLAVIRNTENQVFLALFGGNVEQSTSNAFPVADSLDFWGNNLFHPSNASVQFNSLTERTLKTTAITSFGRTIIESAIKKDLEFFNEIGTTEVSVTIISDDRISISIKTIHQQSKDRIIIVNLKKKSTGDWFISDFNNDFYFG